MNNLLNKIIIVKLIIVIILILSSVLKSYSYINETNQYTKFNVIEYLTKSNIKETNISINNYEENDIDNKDEIKKCIFIDEVEKTYNEKQRKIGARVSVDIETIRKAFIKYMPTIKENINKTPMPDKIFYIDMALFYINIYLSNFKINLFDFPENTLNVSYQEPNYINFSLKGIKGNGNFDLRYDFLFFNQIYNTKFIINWMNLKASIKLGLEKLPKSEEDMPEYYSLKNILCIEMDNIFATFDYDFNLGLSLLEIFADQVKTPIKNYLNFYINESFIKTIKNKAVEQFRKTILKMKLVAPFLDNLSLDATLSGIPFVKNNYFIYDSNFLIYNKDQIETYDINYFKYEMPNYLHIRDDNTFHVECFFNEYVAWTAINTFSRNNVIKVLIDKEVVDEDIIKLDTTLFNTLFPGLVDVYGDHVPCNVVIRAIPPVKDIVLIDKGAKIIINIRLILFTNSFEDPFAVIEGLADIKAQVKMLNDGKINLIIDNYVLNSINVTESKVETNSSVLLTFIKSLLDILLPLLEKEVFTSKLEIKLPVIDDNYFNDSIATFKKDYVVYKVNIRFDPKKNNNNNNNDNAS